MAEANYDATALRFGRLLVLGEDEPRAGGNRYMIVRCDCGVVKSVSRSALRSGSTSSCGCGRSKYQAPIGVVFGRLTVTADGGGTSKHRMLLATCDCGAEGRYLYDNLRRGTTRSCGCLRNEYVPKNKTHGMRNTREFNVWAGIVQRCTDTNCQAYPNYGGRGITLCEEWKSFEQFYADMGPMPEGMSVERLDNEAGYSKVNCRWGTRKEQANNRRSNRIIEFRGKTYTLAQVAELCGIPYNKLRYRLIKNDWSTEKAGIQ